MMNYKVIMLCFIIYLCQFKYSYEENVRQCKNPNLIDLEVKLLNAEINYLESEFMNKMILEKITIQSKLLADSKFKLNKLLPNESCIKRKIVSFVDEYPFRQIIAECTCGKCQATYDLKPILSKKKCKENGLYKWKSRFKRVLVACDCPRVI